MQLVESGSTLTPGLRTDFWDTYEPMYKGVKEELSQLMKMDVPSNKLTELFGYYLAAPHPVIWKRGQVATHKAFKAVQFSIQNRDWVIGTDWHLNDEADDQTQSLRGRVMDTAEHMSMLDERVLFQMLQDASDTELLESIPNAPDGAPLYSTTDGEGGDRFQVTDGNVITGGDISTSDIIREYCFDAKNRFLRFKDGQGQPLFQPKMVDEGLVLVANIDNSKVISEAFKQARTIGILKNVAGTENVAAAAVSNIILDSGLQVKLWLTSRVTNDNLYFFLQSPRAKKPFFKLLRQEVREVTYDMTNDGHAKRTKEVGMQWDARYGYGIMLPYATVMVDNS
jgi:hypothetical protein